MSIASVSRPEVEIEVFGPQGPPGPAGADSTIPGPAGPAGSPGAPGTGGYDETFFFNSASASWELPHGQGTYALNVETLDINGQPFEGDVLYPDPDTIRINWFYPEVGVARVYR